MNKDVKYIEEFLINNGIKKYDTNCYINEHCSIIINDNYYEIKNEDGLMFSNDLNIYWLIGILTYNNYIDKNYIK